MQGRLQAVSRLVSNQPAMYIHTPDDKMIRSCFKNRSPNEDYHNRGTIFNVDGERLRTISGI